MNSGLHTALITPFLNNGSLDLISLEQILTEQLEAAVDGIVILGTTGEAATVSGEERDVIIKFSRDFIDSHCERKPQLIVGTGTNSTQQTLQYCRRAEELGADLVLVVAPYYNKPSQAGIYEHYKFLHDRISIPIVLYNVPARTITEISNEVILKLLSNCDRIVAIKECGTLMKFIDLKTRNLNKKFKQFAGDDAMAMEFKKHGSHGTVSVLSNILPKQLKALHKLMQAGEMGKASELQMKLGPFYSALLCDSNPVVIKHLAYSLEVIVSATVRLPLLKLLPDAIEDTLIIKMQEMRTKEVSLEWSEVL